MIMEYGIVGLAYMLFMFSAVAVALYRMNG